MAEQGAGWNFWYSLAFAGIGALFGVAPAWLLSMWVMWRRCYGPRYALQKSKDGPELMFKLVSWVARMAYAAHSDAIGGPSGGKGGLAGGYVLHITTDDLMTMPAQAIYDLPMRRVSDDAMQMLIKDGEDPFDGSSPKTAYSEATVITEASNIKSEMSKQKGFKLDRNAAQWGIIIVLVIAIFFQLNSGFALDPSNISLGG